MNTLNEAPQPVFSFADAEMGVLSNHLIKLVEKVSGQPRLKRIYNQYIEDELPACDFWVDALERLGIEINLKKEAHSNIKRKRLLERNKQIGEDISDWHIKCARHTLYCNVHFICMNVV